MNVYLDTSAVLRFVLDQPPLLAGWNRWELAYTSELMGVEARRAFDRLRLVGQLDDDTLALAHDELARVEQALGIVALTRAVLQRTALPMPTPVGTLDAIHLASALMLREQREADLTFGTHDAQQSVAARALGFRIANGGPA